MTFLQKHHGQMSDSMLTAFFIILSGGLQDAYTYCCRGKVFANAQTGNIVLLSTHLFEGDWGQALRYLVPVLAFLLGIYIAECVHRHFKRMEKVHWRQLIILAEIVLLAAVGFLPETLNVVVALYPIFFAMSIQWSSFAGARGFYSSTIFSTNNTKQTSLALANYLCDKDRAHLRKLWFYFFTLLSFHTGAAAAFFAVKWWYIRGALAVLPFIAWAYFLAVCERRHEALADEPETIPDNTAQPTSNA